MNTPHLEILSEVLFPSYLCNPRGYTTAEIAKNSGVSQDVVLSWKDAGYITVNPLFKPDPFQPWVFTPEQAQKLHIMAQLRERGVSPLEASQLAGRYLKVHQTTEELLKRRNNTRAGSSNQR